MWEIAAALRRTSGPEARRVAGLAREFGIHERQVTIALNYAAAHRAEIEARVEANERALAEAERVAAERQRAAVDTCPVVLVRKAWWPKGALAPRLAAALDQWAATNQQPGFWPHWLKAELRQARFLPR